MLDHQDEQLQHALELACSHLNRRSRTTSEIRAHLERRGVSEPSAEAAIGLLCEQRLLDDTAFARAFVSDKRELEQWGSGRIRRGLLAHGVAAELADAALAEPVLAQPALAQGAGVTNERPETELDRALALLRRRFPAPPRDRRERERALGLLLRKGYESELALDALTAHARGK